MVVFGNRRAANGQNSAQIPFLSIQSRSGPGRSFWQFARCLGLPRTSYTGGMRAAIACFFGTVFMIRATAAFAGEPVVATHGMVATTHKRAVEIGVEILKQGGNAVDAAIATNAAMGVCEPMSCGMGGDLYAIVWDAKSHKLYGLNASGRSPYAASIEYFKKRGLSEIPTSGPLSWSVPGAVDGWDQLRQKFGTMNWEQLLTPAVRCAEQGVEVPKTIGGFFQAAEHGLAQHPDSAKTYLVKDGHAPNVGDVFKNPRLAATYRLIIAGGRDAYYNGPIAKEIVEFSQHNGGLFSMKDFADHTSTWVDPVSTTYRGYQVFTGGQIP